MLYQLFNSHRRKLISGFTAVELIVVIGIFTVVTGVVMANLPKFRDQTALELTAQDLAITIRQAQVFGVSTRGFSGQFPSHGIFFNLLDNVALDPWTKSFVLFADVGVTPTDYDQPATPCATNSECIEQFNIRGNVQIDSLWGCGAPCVNLNTISNQLNVVFVRPSPGAVFNPAGSPSYNKVKIRLKSVRDGLCRNVVVWITGQIFVENDPSCNNNA